MSKKTAWKSDLPADPVGDALADVYLFLLRKAAERKPKTTATVRTDGVAGNLPVQAEITAPDGEAHEGEGSLGG